MDERFTRLADLVSEAMGSWKVSAGCLFLVMVWAGFGPSSGYSDSWQLWVNTPTTVVELFLGLFTLAAANRVEKRNWELHQAMAKMLERVEVLEREDVEVLRLEQRELVEMLGILRALRDGEGVK